MQPNFNYWQALVSQKKKELFNINVKLAQTASSEEKKSLEEHKNTIKKELREYMVKSELCRLEEQEKKGRGR